ncbi:MAG: glycosyltransferase family 2 protein [Bacteroidota bacterium]|jgi:glycosyltransferase involved in cell wall biosynthesis|nr:glycosyltransferase [Bacteroidota bacterium]
MQISVVIPLFNEEESIPELASWIDRVMREHSFTYEVIWVDDGSRDQSWRVIESLTATGPNHKAIQFRRNQGKSAALNEGFKCASGRVIITMDADLQDSPDEIPALYQMITVQQFDMVSGWKRKRHDPISKTIPSKFFNYVTRVISGIKLHDFNCGLKAYSSQVVKAIELQGEMHRYVPVIAKWAGFSKIGEKVVEHRERKFGYSKFGLERFINGFLDLLSITFITRFGKRPMHLFGTLGILSFFIGFAILVYLSTLKLFYDVVKITDRPMFFLGIIALIIGTQLFLTGFLAELISRIQTEKSSLIIQKKIHLD